MKRQFRAFVVLISCFMSMLLLSPLACWADQNIGANEYESVPETQSDSSDQTAAAADETAPSIDVAVEPKEAAPDVSYKSHISGIGWESTFTSNGSTSGTTGQSRRLEALRVTLPNSETLVSNTALMFKMKAGRIGFLMEPSPAQRERAFRLKPSSSS